MTFLKNKQTAWDHFFKAKMVDIFTTSQEVVDFGGSLRLDTGKSNRVEIKNQWLNKYVSQVSYKIIDPVPDYNPDIVGDIHKLPLADNSQEAIICMAVLEHVENPILAMEELYRVMKPGAKLFVYVPFLFYYHAHEGYYRDYWRFTKDTLEMLAKPFSHKEFCAVKGPIETLFNLTPLGRWRIVKSVVRYLDTLFYKKGSNQVSGYYMFLIK